MLVDFDALKKESESKWDLVVMGAGAVGILLAVGFAKNGRKVLLLESGSEGLAGFEPSTFSSVGRDHQGIRISRSRTLGGTTNLWGGQLVEFMEEDFRDRNWAGGDAWPIPFSEISRFYRQTYLELGVSEDFIDDQMVWKQINGKRPVLRNGLEVFLTRWMKKPNFSKLFGDLMRHSKDLVVATGCTVCDFSFRDQLVDSVTVSNGDQLSCKISARKYVLAAGTFENTRLLLHAKRHNDCPWKNNHNIGKRFQDHLGGRVAKIYPADSKRFFDMFSTIVTRGEKFQPKIRWENEKLNSEGLLNIQAMLAFEGSVSENLVFLKQFVKAAVFGRRIGSLRGLLFNCVACSKYLIPLMWRYIVQHRILVPGGSKISLHIQSETIPLDKSEITVDPNKLDRYGLPRLLLNWQVSGEELGHIRHFTNEVSKAFESSQIARLDIESLLKNNDTKFLDSLYDTGHQVGGSIMGSNERNGVVDCDLKVFGVDNLFVLGASTFRSCGNANTTFTALAFAIRLQQHLIKIN